MKVRATDIETLRRNGGLKTVRRPDHPDDPEWGALVLLEHNDDGSERVCAIANSCAHHGVVLTSGYRKDGWIECPYHGWRFELLTGQCLHLPTERIATYDVQIDDECIVWVEFPG
jgi:nitrite reductase/ring-hydroxylating ferredoxin subunit